MSALKRGKQGQVYGRGAFQAFGSARRGELNELMADVFGREDIDCIAADWRGIVYFVYAQEPEEVNGFDPSSFETGVLATLTEVERACTSGDIVTAVAGDDFAEWLAITGRRELAMGSCVAPKILQFLGGDSADRADDESDLITYIAVSAALAGRLEVLGIAPGDEIPDDVYAEIFDDSRW